MCGFNFTLIDSIPSWTARGIRLGEGAERRSRPGLVDCMDWARMERIRSANSRRASTSFGFAKTNCIRFLVNIVKRTVHTSYFNNSSI